MATEINLTPTGTPFKTDDGIITGRTWGNPSDCRAGVLIVHGLGAHSGWNEALGRRFKVRGFYTLAYDQVGCGKRNSQRIKNRQQWLDDFICAYQMLAQQVGDKPLFVMGNSMGGLVALASLKQLKPKPDGIVLFSPGFDGCPQTFTIPYKLKATIKALFDPRAKIDLPYDATKVSREETVRHWIENDKESVLSLPGEMMLELLRLTLEMPKYYQSLQVPLIMLTAGKEYIVDNKAALAAFNKIEAPEKKHLHFEESWHDLLLDRDLDNVCESLCQWLSKICPEKLTAL